MEDGMKQQFLTEPSAIVMISEGEVTKSKPYEAVLEKPDGATHAIILLECWRRPRFEPVRPGTPTFR
jgi:hypothetical protein